MAFGGNSGDGGGWPGARGLFALPGEQGIKSGMSPSGAVQPNSISGADAPTAATGVNVADAGWTYFDTTNGDEYLNVGTITVPSWKLKAREA